MLLSVLICCVKMCSNSTTCFDLLSRYNILLNDHNTVDDDCFSYRF